MKENILEERDEDLFWFLSKIDDENEKLNDAMRFLITDEFNSIENSFNKVQMIQKIKTRNAETLANILAGITACQKCCEEKDDKNK